MPEQIAGAITEEALVMAGFEFMQGFTKSLQHDWYAFNGMKISVRTDWNADNKRSVEEIQPKNNSILVKTFDPPITTMPRLMDEIEAFEECLKPKDQPSEDIPLSAEQFIADGWEQTAGYNFYRQGMYACWVDNDRTWRLLVGNDESIHTSMQSLKAHIRALIDKKYQWLI